jgi:hypothetical protein
MEPTRRVWVVSAFSPPIIGCFAAPVRAEVTSPWDVATAADALALLASAAAEGCAACIVQLPGHAVALRQGQGDGEWFLLDSQAPGPRRLEGAEALVGSVWTLVQADGEGDFLPEALQVDLAGRGGMCQLVLLGPLHAVVDDLSAARWCHQHAVSRLRVAAALSVSIVGGGRLHQDRPDCRDGGGGLANAGGCCFSVPGRSFGVWVQVPLAAAADSAVPPRRPSPLDGAGGAAERRAERAAGQ